MRPRSVRRQIKAAARYQYLSELLDAARQLASRFPYAADTDQAAAWAEAGNYMVDYLARRRARTRTRVNHSIGARSNRDDELGIPTTHDLAG